MESLKKRYDCLRLIHQMHVWMILEAAPLREGGRRELWRLHDTVQQHLRALKAINYEPSSPFITSILELKPTLCLSGRSLITTQSMCHIIPHYLKLLEFINLQAQASEALISEHKRAPCYEDCVRKVTPTRKPIVAFTATVGDSAANSCVICKTEKHPLYACSQFKALPHEKMVSTLETHNLCLNCLESGHFVKQCKSLHRCRICQKAHHTLLHTNSIENTRPPPDSTVNPITTNAAAGVASNLLLMTCQVLIDAPNGSSVTASALLDSASSASFMSERLSKFSFPQSQQNTKISGVAGVWHSSPLQAIANFSISPVSDPAIRFSVTAIVVPRVTCNLPLIPIPFDLKWTHLNDLPLADPDFGRPGRVDMLLGVMFAKLADRSTEPSL